MKCNLCEFSTNDEKEMISHLKTVHGEYLLKNKMTAEQHWYHHVNRFKLKNIGVCSCGLPKKWNPDENKYEHYCYSPEHTQKLRQTYENNMEKTYGTSNPASTVDHQVKMMAGRTIAKTYEWKNKKFIVLSDIEYGILDILRKRGRNPNRIEAPAVSIKLQYKLPNDTSLRNHFPDVYDDEFNAIYSGKDGMDNPNRHPNMKKDRIKNLYEYQTILNNTNYNYIQVEGKEGLRNFDKELRVLEQMHKKGSRYVMPPRIDVHMLTESVDEQSLFGLDLLVIKENGDIGLTSSNLNMKKVFVSKMDNLWITEKSSNDLVLNYNKLVNNYSDTMIPLSIADDHETIQNMLEQVKTLKQDCLENYIIGVY